MQPTPTANKAIGTFLTPDSFYSRFEKLAAACSESYFKFERLQSYDETGAPYHDAYLAGNWRESIKLFSEQYAARSGFDENLCARDISSVRVRVIERPLSNYVRWELRTYEQTVKFGQRILICDLTGDPKGSPLSAVTDFIMFDRKAVLAHDYGLDGKFRGGWDVDPEIVTSRFAPVLGLALRRSISLGSFIHKNPELFQQL